jgi:beta-lactamase regulating signal transducer with metallopeptidase domain
MVLVILVESRLRPDWREAVLWLAMFAPIVIATFSSVVGLFAGTASVAAAGPVITLNAPVTIGFPSTQAESYVWLVFFIWMAGAAILIARDAIRHRKLIGILDRKLTDRRDVVELASRMAGSRTIRVSESQTLPVPIAMGTDEVCLPSHFMSEGSSHDLEPIIAHEVAHLRRRDPLLQQLARLIAVVLWWQPLNMVVARRLKAVAELRADRLCSTVVGPLRLARALLEFAQQSNGVQPVGMPAFPAGLLRERIAQLIADARPQSLLRVRITACVALLLASLFFAPRFAVLRAQLPTMLSPLVVRASQVATISTALPGSNYGQARLRQSIAQPKSSSSEKDVVDALSMLLKDREQHVRVAARESLRRIDSNASRAALANDSFATIDSSKK